MKLPLKLRTEIMTHLEGGDKETGLPLAQALITQFPQYTYSGVAYRAIMSLEEIGKVKLHPGDSFTSQKESVDQFFSDNGFELHEGTNGVVVEAEITGFNLGLFLRNELDKFPAGDHEDLEAYLSENEIISLEISKIINEYEYKPNLGR